MEAHSATSASLYLQNAICHIFAKNTMDHAEEEDNKYTVSLEMNIFTFIWKKEICKQICIFDWLDLKI